MISIHDNSFCGTYWYTRHFLWDKNNSNWCDCDGAPLELSTLYCMHNAFCERVRQQQLYDSIFIIAEQDSVNFSEHALCYWCMKPENNALSSQAVHLWVRCLSLPTSICPFLERSFTDQVISSNGVRETTLLSKHHCFHMKVWVSVNFRLFN